MVNKLEKQLHKLSQKDFKRFMDTWEQVVSGNWDGLDIKPLKGKTKHYRVRVGNMRLQFRKNEQDECIALLYSKRDENTYK